MILPRGAVSVHRLRPLAKPNRAVFAGLHTSGVEQENRDLKPETLNFLFEWARGAIDVQTQAAAGLDAKVAQAFVAGGIVLGLPTLGDLSSDGLAATIALGFAIGAFIVLALAAVRALWVRRFRGPMSPTQAWTEYWSDDVAVIKWAIVDDTATAYAENEAYLDFKRNALVVAQAMLGVEAVAVAAALIAAVA